MRIKSNFLGRRHAGYVQPVSRERLVGEAIGGIKPVPILLLVMLGLSFEVSAACSREDVEFYLSKGFTPEQITTLCGAGEEQKSAAPAVVVTPPAQGVSADNEKFFMEAIKARNVVVTEETLAYTLKVCIQYGEADLYGFAPEACPNVRFTLALHALEVKPPVKRFLFTIDEIEVKGAITREVVDGPEKFSPEVQQLILKKLESGNETAIPVRDDIPIEQIYQRLQQLAQ